MEAVQHDGEQDDEIDRVDIYAEYLHQRSLNGFLTKWLPRASYAAMGFIAFAAVCYFLRATPVNETVDPLDRTHVIRPLK